MIWGIEELVEMYVSLCKTVLMNNAHIVELKEKKFNSLNE